MHSSNESCYVMKKTVISILALCLNWSDALGSDKLTSDDEEWSTKAPQVCAGSEDEVDDRLAIGLKVYYKWDPSEKKITVNLDRTLCTTRELPQQVANYVWSFRFWSYFGFWNRIDVSFDSMRLITATLSETKFCAETSTAGCNTWSTVGRWLDHYGRYRVEGGSDVLHDEILSDLIKRFSGIEKIYLSSDRKITVNFSEGFRESLEKNDIVILTKQRD